MTITSGTWGFGRWGSQLWGWSSFGVLASGNLITDALIKAINQNEPVKQEISATILIDSVDQSEFLENFQVKNSSIGASKIASITFASSAVALTNRVSVIEIYFNYLISGDEFSCLIFKGKPRSIVTYPGRVSRSTVVTAYDDSRVLDENAPVTVLYAGSALTLIRSELNNLGISAIESSFQDYTATPALDVSAFATVRELINYLINGKRKSYAFMTTDGVFRIIDATQAMPTGWGIPLSGQTSNDPVEKSSGIYNRVTVAGVTYDDTAHQTANGILPLVITAASYCTSDAERLIMATQICEESQLQDRNIETPLNPFLDVGNGFNLLNPDATTSFVRVDEITQSFNWPAGAWQTTKVKEIPEVPAIPATSDILLQSMPEVDFLVGGEVTSRNAPAGTTQPTGTSRYPTFTLSANKKITFISAFFDPAPASVTLTLANQTTAETFDFTLTASSNFGELQFTSTAGVEITAGAYQVQCADLGWLMIAKQLNLYGKALTQSKLVNGEWTQVVTPDIFITSMSTGWFISGPGIALIRGIAV